MDASMVEQRYLKVTKKFGLISGVWPYQTKLSKYSKQLVILFLIMLSIVVQIAKLVFFFSFDTLMEQSPFLFAAFALVCKLQHRFEYGAQFKELLKAIFLEWKIDRPKGEFDLMNMYAERAVFISTFYVVSSFISALLFIQITAIPLVLDIVAPLNVSRGIGYAVPSYYYIDEHKYYYLIVSHLVLEVGSVFVVYVSCDTTYIYVVQHACGLLAVSGNAIRKAFDKDKKDVIQLTHVAYENVCDSIRAHEHAIKYLNTIESIYTTHLMIIVGIVILSFTFTLLQVSTMQPSGDFYKYFGFLVIQLVHLFLLTIQGQFVTNAGDDIYNSIYDSSWYNATCKTQSLYILALVRSLKSPEFSAGRVLTMNLQTFAEIVKASVSYFMVLQSMSMTNHV